MLRTDFLHCASMPRVTDSSEVLGPAPQRVHLLVLTHTTRHLESCIASICRQTSAPESITVSCDVDDPAVSELLASVWARTALALERARRPIPTIHHVGRTHLGEARLNQVRNNGLRAIIAAGGRREDLVVVIDGDMVLAPDAIEHHRALAAAGADVVVPFRINTTESQAASVSADALLEENGPWPAELTPRTDQLASMLMRDRRYRRQLAVRRLLPWLTKPHKPKLLGGHHAARLGALIDVNGYDEMYVGYGYDDDDLARRLHGIRGLRWAIAVRDIPAFHLWHPSRAPVRPTEAPGYARFRRRDLPVRCERGLVSPLTQPEPVTRVISGCAQVAFSRA